MKAIKINRKTPSKSIVNGLMTSSQLSKELLHWQEVHRFEFGLCDSLDDLDDDEIDKDWCWSFSFNAKTLSQNLSHLPNLNFCQKVPKEWKLTLFITCRKAPKVLHTSIFASFLLKYLWHTLSAPKNETRIIWAHISNKNHTQST